MKIRSPFKENQPVSVAFLKRWEDMELKWLPLSLHISFYPSVIVYSLTTCVQRRKSRSRPQWPPPALYWRLQLGPRGTFTPGHNHKARAQQHHSAATWPSHAPIDGFGPGKYLPSVELSYWTGYFGNDQVILKAVILYCFH